MRGEGSPGVRPLAAAALGLVAMGACRVPAREGDGALGARAEVEQTLDALHRRAAEADEVGYFELFEPRAVFLGTDPAERWSLEEFRAYAHPHFAAGRGWTFTPLERHVELAPTLDLAWFDERLSSAAYGTCRGTGVLRRVGGRWRVAQYSLSLPVPNELTGDLVERIRARSGG